MSDVGKIQHHCDFCGAELERASASGISTHLCPECKAPQPLRKDEDYFTLMGVPRKFAQDQAGLQKKFYELSRLLHPDRFTNATDARQREYSLQRMSEVNLAYQTLRSSELLLDYLLGAAAAVDPDSHIPAKGKIPMDLAEEWFELQDEVMENPQAAMSRLAQLKESLRERAERFHSEMRRWETAYDEGKQDQALSEMRRIRQESAYIASMRRDMDRMRTKLEGGQ